VGEFSIIFDAPRPAEPVGQIIPGATESPSKPTAFPTASPLSKAAAFPTPSPLNKAAANLTGLSSYQASLRLKAKGTHGGQPFEWTFAITRLVSSDPAMEIARIDTIGLGQGNDYSGTVIVRAGKQFFARWSSDSACASVSRDQVSGFLLAPGTLLPELGGAQKASSGQIGGLDAERYELSGKDTGVTGEVWMATGGFVVQASLKQDGSLTGLGSAAKGHAEWEYALSNIDKPVSFDLPSSCRRLLGDSPMPGDAANLSATDDQVRYTTSISVNDLANFYADKMKQAGWESFGTPTITKDDARIGFTRDEIRWQINIRCTLDGEIGV
jgi:hypothetical protein